MQILNTGYEILIAGLGGAFTAQILKFLIYFLIERKIDWRIFTTTGGMPSSHSAGVVGLSVAAGIIEGFASPLFAVSTGFAFIVMYDAAGLRRASGKMAVCLNKIMDDFYKHEIQEVGGRLKELLGHTPVEVFAGAIYGIFFAYLVHYCLILY